MSISSSLVGTFCWPGLPTLDFTALAAGLGVPATRATTAGELAAGLRQALAEPGPHLIEAVLP